MKKLPPIEKIYEAYTAIADGRIEIDLQEQSATMTSSTGLKSYTVQWKDNVYSSTDNATYWQGYPGYPIIAVLMLQGKIPLDEGIAQLFAGVPWFELNKKYKRDYAQAVASVIKERGLDSESIQAAVDEAYEALTQLDITVKRSIK